MVVELLPLIGTMGAFAYGASTGVAGNFATGALRHVCSRVLPQHREHLQRALAVAFERATRDFVKREGRTEDTRQLLQQFQEAIRNLFSTSTTTMPGAVLDALMFEDAATLQRELWSLIRDRVDTRSPYFHDSLLPGLASELVTAFGGVLKEGQHQQAWIEFQQDFLHQLYCELREQSGNNKVILGHLQALSNVPKLVEQLAQMFTETLASPGKDVQVHLDVQLGHMRVTLEKTIHEEEQQTRDKLTEIYEAVLNIPAKMRSQVDTGGLVTQEGGSVASQQVAGIPRDPEVNSSDVQMAAYPSRRKTVLVVDDERSLAELARMYLRREGFDVEVAYNGREGLEKALVLHPALILTDIMMPEMDGLEMIRAIQRQMDVPLIFLTARADEVDKVVGLEIGADDYITKPFNPRELVARVKAVLRRTESGSRRPNAVQQVGDLAIDVDDRQVQMAGTVVPLRLKEFDLLVALVQNAGLAMSRDRLLKLVWGEDFFGDARTLDVHIAWLRDKIEGSNVKIVTIWGFGYKLTVTEDST